MKVIRETSKIYAGRERVVYRLSEPLADRTYPFIDSITGDLRFGVADLVMIWGDKGEHLNVARMDCNVRDFTPINAADAALIRAAIVESELPGHTA